MDEIILNIIFISSTTFYLYLHIFQYTSHLTMIDTFHHFSKLFPLDFIILPHLPPKMDPPGLPLPLKRVCPISQDGDFQSTDRSSPKKSCFQISVNQVNRFIEKYEKITYIAIVCISLYKRNYGNHSYSHFFFLFSLISSKHWYFSVVKFLPLKNFKLFDRGNEKKVSFLLIPKS